VTGWMAGVGNEPIIRRRVRDSQVKLVAGKGVGVVVARAIPRARAVKVSGLLFKVGSDVKELVIVQFVAVKEVRVVVRRRVLLLLVLWSNLS